MHFFIHKFIHSSFHNFHLSALPVLEGVGLGQRDLLVAAGIMVETFAFLKVFTGLADRGFFPPQVRQNGATSSTFPSLPLYRL